MRDAREAIRQIHEQSLSGLLTLRLEPATGGQVSVTLSFLNGRWLAAESGRLRGADAIALLQSPHRLFNERWFAVSQGLSASVSADLPDLAAWLGLGRGPAQVLERRRQLHHLRELMNETLGLDGDAIIARCLAACPQASDWATLQRLLQAELAPFVGPEQADALVR